MRRGFSFTSLRQRVLFIFLAVVLIITFLTMAITGFLTHLQVNNLIRQNALCAVRSHVQNIASWRQERIHELQQLAKAPLLKTMDWDEVEPFLRRQIEDLADYYLIFFLADPQGDYNTSLMREAGNIADRSYFAQAMAGQAVLSEPLLSRSTGERVLVVATPVWDEQENGVMGVLGLSLALSKIEEQLMSVVMEFPKSQVLIVDGQGLIIAHSNPQAPSAHDPSRPLSWEAAQGSFTEGSFRNFYAEIPGFDQWRLIIQIPKTYINEPVQRLIFYLALLAIALVLIVTRIGTWVSATISDPIIELSSVFKRGSQGDLTVRAKVASADEIGETSASFNRMMETIGTMTYYDPITKLPNRQSFLDHLQNTVRDNEMAALVLLAIRNFSELKTLSGPDLTDQILEGVAITLRSFHYEGAFLARLGDGEFGLLLPLNARGVLRVIDELEEFLRSPLHIQSCNWHVQLYGGATISEKGNLDFELFYQQAQSALYEAERAPETQIKLYNPATHQAVMERVRFQGEIRSGLAQGQFTVFYQPIVNLEEKRVVGKEALIRWQHPEKGLLLPHDFLLAAEQGELIEEIGKFVLTKTCADHQLWHNGHGDLGWVAVNISANHFRSPLFPDLIQSILTKCRETPLALHIEITEDAMLSPTEAVLANLEKLRRMGISLAIDDFGTAYSSLEYIIKYPLETLKIDRTFIELLDKNVRTQGLVQAVVAMGQNLSMMVVAEGVERLPQVRLLLKMGCIHAQGFYFSPAVPGKDYPLVAAKLDEKLKGNAFLENT